MDTVSELEASLEKTGGRLDNIAQQLTTCDHISENLSDLAETEAVEGLLQTVRQVQVDYKTFRNDLSEVRELQKQIYCDLQTSAIELQKRMAALKHRMPAHANLKHDLDESGA